MFAAPDPNHPGREKYPYVVPLMYGFDCEDDIPVLYMHGTSRPNSRKLHAIRRNEHVAFSVETDVQISAGLGLPKTCVLTTARFFSVVGTGTIELLNFSGIVWDEIDWMHPPAAIHGFNIIMRQQTGKMAENEFLEKWEFDPRFFPDLVMFKLTIDHYTEHDHAYDCTLEPLIKKQVST